MLKAIFKKNSVKMFFSFLMGAMLVLIFASKENNNNVIDLEKIKGISYADISIDIIDDINDPELPGIVEFLCIRKNNYPFIYLYKDSYNKIVRWGISNGKDGTIALSEFDKGRISDFGIYGNKVHENKRMPVFYFSASDKPGVWQQAKYLPASGTVEEKGKIINYKLKGELYQDIDFDGQFDAKRVYNEKSEIIFLYIFVNGKWLVMDNRGSGEKIQKIGYLKLDTLEAVTFDGKQKIYYDFEIGKGWKKRSIGRVRKK